MNYVAPFRQACVPVQPISIDVFFFFFERVKVVGGKKGVGKVTTHWIQLALTNAASCRYDVLGLKFSWSRGYILPD